MALPGVATKAQDTEPSTPCKHVGNSTELPPPFPVRPYQDARRQTQSVSAQPLGSLQSPESRTGSSAEVETTLPLDSADVLVLQMALASCF